MTLATGVNTPYRVADRINIPVGAAKVIFEGSIVVINAGYAEMGSAAENMIAAGRAENFVDNSSGTNGGKCVTVKRGCFRFYNSTTDAIEQTNVYSDCYIEDECTVCATGTGKSKAGKVLAIDDDGVWVEIR